MSRSQQITIKQESPQKRRGRPQKKTQNFFEEGEQLFSIHDNVFHAGILFYTFRIFDKAPTRSKFNPTIGFSIYEKVKSIPEDSRKYYDNDEVAQNRSKNYADNYPLRRFFINSLTFGPKCVIDQFYSLFEYVLEEEPTLESTIAHINKEEYKYILFNCPVMEYLQARTTQIKERLQKIIETELSKLLEIVIYTLLALKKGEKNNKFAYILDSEQDLFKRGVNSKPKKKLKRES